MSLGIGSNLIRGLVAVIHMLPPPPPLLSSLVNAREDLARTVYVSSSTIDSGKG